MTGFKIWYVLAPLFVFVEFAIGYCSLGYERAKHMYVGQHRAASKKNNNKTISATSVAGWSCFMLCGYTTYMLLVESSKEMLDFAIHFVTFDDLLDRSIAAAILICMFAASYGMALYAANRLGLSFRRSVHQKKHINPATSLTSGVSSCSSVRYVDGTPSETTYCRSQECDSVELDPEEVLRVFRDAQNRLEESERRRKIDEARRGNPARERFYAVMGIADC